jgi:sugar lactone lactonase YvrE
MLKTMHGVIAASGSTPAPPLASDWDISTASYGSPGISFNVGSEDSIPLGMTFKTDGTRMYMVGVNTDSVYQYDLSTPWDISTASVGSPGVSFSVLSEATGARDLAFNADGTRMYVIGATSGPIVQYDLSTAWDVSSASFGSPGITFSVSSETATAQGITFNIDGTRMYIVGSTGSNVYQYELSAAWDISTASYGSPGVSFSGATEDSGMRDVSFKTDGTRMFMLGSSTNTIYQYDLSTAWDVSSASFGIPGVSFSVASEDTSTQSLTFKTDGTRMYVLGFNGTSVYQYDL